MSGATWALAVALQVLGGVPEKSPGDAPASKEPRIPGPAAPARACRLACLACNGVPARPCCPSLAGPALPAGAATDSDGVRRRRALRRPRRLPWPDRLKSRRADPPSGTRTVPLGKTGQNWSKMIKKVKTGQNWAKLGKTAAAGGGPRAHGRPPAVLVGRGRGVPRCERRSVPRRGRCIAGAAVPPLSRWRRETSRGARRPVWGPILSCGGGGEGTSCAGAPLFVDARPAAAPGLGACQSYLGGGAIWYCTRSPLLLFLALFALFLHCGGAVQKQPKVQKSSQKQ